jgi:uncharacterized protein YuzE
MMEITELVISYDKEADVVYLSFGKPRPSVSEEVDDYVVVRREPKTGRITGVTIMNFGRYFSGDKEMKVDLDNPSRQKGSRRTREIRSMTSRLQKQTKSKKQVDEEIEWAKAGTRKAVTTMLKE